MIHNKLMHALFVALGVSTVPFQVAFADEDSSGVTQLDAISVEDSFEETLKPIHISTSTTLQPEKSELSRTSSASLGEVLEGIPGVNNLSSGSQSGKPVVRGDTSLRLPVLSNGMEMEYQAYGTRHNPNIDPVLMDQLEVIRGPQGLKYSSQAVKSAVNVTGPNIEYVGKGQSKTSAELIGEVNSNNHEMLVGVKAKHASEGFGIAGGVTLRKGDDYVSPKTAEAGDVKPGDPAGIKPLVTGTTPDTNFESQAAVLGLGFQAEWGEVELRHSYWLSKQSYLGVEPDPSGYNLEPAAGQKLKNEVTQLKAEYFTGDWIIKPSYGHTRNEREAMHEHTYEELSDFKSDPEYLDLVVHRDDYKLAFEHPDVMGWSGEFGMSHFDKNQKLRSGDLTPSATQNGSGVYAVEKHSFGAQAGANSSAGVLWDVEVGLRYDTQKVKAPLSAENEHFWNETHVYDASNNERDFADWSGAFGVAYHATSNWTLTGNLGRSFRTPSIFELYASGAHGGVQAFQKGNPNLKAETSINSELAATWQSARLHSTFAVYRNQVDNYIVLENSEETLYCNHDGACQPTQDLAHPNRKMLSTQTHALIQGAEWSAKYQMTPQLQWRATAEVIRGRDTKNNRDLPLMPADNATLKANYTFHHLGQWHKPYVGLGTKYVVAKKSAGSYEPFSQYDDEPFGVASTKDYWLWNLQTGGEVKLGKYSLKLDLTVQNVFDTAYRDFLDTYKGYAQGRGRNIRLHATMKF